ncbi:DUF2892 domain-containing protein [Metallumcola ferriviriculae]|uniref:DUF2892 domain-containing protein n=1 Tax=Metallumcola ferriviriculae TaxID=3039180 RepID=A0AAU0URW1_9FIRM|nr:DUF2892 domain-containing protein [Desulfitibacteraceae bacterium MK1]
MPKKNVGKTDQVIRYILAALLLVTAFLTNLGWIWFGVLLIVGIALLATAATQY